MFNHDKMLNIKFFIPPFKDKSIEEFINRCYGELQLNFSEFNFSNPFLFFIVAYDDYLKPVGFLQASLIYERVEIEQILVLEKYRGYKYGSVLMNGLIRYAMRMNCNSISLEVNKKNSIAIKLYKKFDFKIVSLRRNYYNNKDDAYLMVRKVVIKDE